MSNELYINEEGAGQKHSDLCHYSQVVVIGDTAKCSGQGGWDTSGKMDPKDTVGQVQLAFDNVDKVLRASGFRGWEDVYLVRSYHVSMAASFDPTVAKLKQRIPGHRPVWTAIGVSELAFPEMLIEIEVEAKKQS